MIFKTKDEKTEKEKSEKKIEIPPELPIFPVLDMVLFPKMVSPAVVAEEGLIKMIDEALVAEKMIAVVAQKSSENGNLKPENLYSWGTVAHILRMIKVPDGSQRLILQGLNRINIEKYTTLEPYLKARVRSFPEEASREGNIELEALISNIRNLFQKIMKLAPYLPTELGIMALNIEDPGSLADLIASSLNISLAEKQEVLETLDIKNRLEKVTLFLNNQLEVLNLGSKIQDQIKGEMEKNQREYFLRQQLKAIQEELGEKDEKTLEIEELKEKIKKADLPEMVAKEAERELNRLSRMPPAAAEYTVCRTYLDWLVELPWSISTKDNLDISQAKRVLDEDHYDLEKVKKRTLEYLAVRKLKKDMKGPILCFVGPPGVGKTSVGRSIARALGRKFVRLSLGGVRDEAEIRGHRRTYVGALPGRIIQGINRAGSNNPVFMLDEVDKLGMDFRGDPASALLEVLDPEQNNTFSDHYLEVDFDLSGVMFITTANLLDPIPPALKDRMEVLELPGYTEEEKLMIARKYLLPKQLGGHGLKEEQLNFEDDALKKIIRDYTREAGLRNLEREIANVCRAVARQIAEGKIEQIFIKEDMVSDFLGPVKFFSEVAERTSEAGVATGMAWTQAGGEIIFVEAAKMRGKKSLNLTGQLGDVMKESAQAALTYVRTKAKELGIPEDFYESQDIHIHVPQGSIPKDGPSAGITIFTALTSLFTGRPVRSDIAMTGEITLRGLVLPVGGIKEKVLAAKRAGINNIILPRKNEKDLEDIPKNVRESMNFFLVEKMDEVTKIALRNGKKE